MEAKYTRNMYILIMHFTIIIIIYSQKIPEVNECHEQQISNEIHYLSLSGAEIDWTITKKS